MNHPRGRARLAAIALCAIVAGLLALADLTAPMASSRAAGPSVSAAHALLPPPHPSATRAGAALEWQPEPPAVFAPDVAPAAGAPAVTSGTWTALNNSPSFFASAGAYVLTDGRILVEDAQLTDVAWWTLTPDINGSYLNGTWKQVASPGPCANGKSAGSTIYAPLYYASAVLPDGRFVMVGGDYDYNYTYVNGTGEVWTNQGAIYDPVANSWTCIAAPSGWTQIGDAQSVVLPDGTFIIANPFNDQVATLNASTSPPHVQRSLHTGRQVGGFRQRRGRLDTAAGRQRIDHGSLELERRQRDAGTQLQPGDEHMEQRGNRARSAGAAQQGRSAILRDRAADAAAGRDGVRSGRGWLQRYLRHAHQQLVERAEFSDDHRNLQQRQLQHRRRDRATGGGRRSGGAAAGR